MTKAEVFEKLFNTLERDEKGMFPCLPRHMLSPMDTLSVRVDRPYGADSSDPTEVWTFADGSSLHVGNPNQKTFAVNLYVRTGVNNQEEK